MGISGYVVTALIGLYHRLGKCRKKEKHRLEWEEERRKSMQNLYRAGREINHWRHDMLAELNVLYCLQKNGKYKEVEAHMEKLYGSLNGCLELPQPTGNEGLDAALVKAAPRCRERGIHFRYAVLGSPWGVDSVSLGNLMDNLLSNGLEACMHAAGEREMDLVVRDTGAGLEIWLGNSIRGSVLEHNPDLKSSKKEKDRHGFGMESIYRIVEEHEGAYEYWEEGEWFRQWLYLNYKGEDGEGRRE